MQNKEIILRTIEYKTYTIKRTVGLRLLDEFMKLCVNLIKNNLQYKLNSCKFCQQAIILLFVFPRQIW